MRIKRILILLMFVLLITGGVLLVSAVKIIKDAKLEQIFEENLAQKQQIKALERTSLLYAGSKIQTEQLQNYFYFTQEKISLEQWLADLSSEGKIQLVAGKPDILILSDIELPPLISNDCLSSYCFQHKDVFADIPPGLWKGLIGIEDYRFLEHSGVDIKSIFRAILIDLREMKLAQGGSTITQQLIKNLILTNEKSLLRKYKEIILAFYIESELSKEEILEAYFNETYWGSWKGIKIKGFYAASLFYFGKSPSLLSNFETAILVGLLKGPSYFDPLKYLERLKIRTELVYGRLVELNLIPDLPEQKWRLKDWEDWQAQLKIRQGQDHFFEMVTVVNSKNKFPPYEQYILGLSVQQVLKQYLAKKSVDDFDFSVKAMVAPANIDLSCIEESNCSRLMWYYSKNERELKSGITTEKHQVGSILKPIIYDIFINLGKSLDDTVALTPLTLQLKSGPWTPREASKATTEGEMTLSEALKKSKNIPVIRMADELGFDLVEPVLKDYIPTLQVPLREFPAQLIGSVEMSVFDVFKAYLLFLQRECKKVIYLEKDLENSVIWHLANPDETTIAGQVGKELSERKFFGKTGTTNNALDNWYVAFNGEDLMVIWLGLEGDRRGKSFKLSGAQTAFQIYQNYLLKRGKKLRDVDCSIFQTQAE